MSPILDLQKRSAEIGRIRIGMTIVRNGKNVPTTLENFRLTTASERVAREVADLFGGEARPWQRSEKRPEWEVLTDARELPILIPPGRPLVQHYEMWSAGGCARRCDGVTEQISGGGCMCPAAGDARMDAAAKGDACKPISRLSVVLPDAPGLGVWLLATGGYNAALELAGAADLLHQMATADVFLPAVLRLEQRSSSVPGKPRRDYAVPVLEIGASIRALAAGDYGAGGMQLPAPPPGHRALEAGHTQPPPPEPTDDPDWRPGEDGVVDAEIVEDPEILAQTVMACESKADVQALVDRARTAGLLTVEVTDPVSGARLVLRDLLATRWRALP